MTKEQRGILVAMALGDGSLKVGSSTKAGLPHVRIVMKHSSRQEEYAEYKADLLASILGGKRPTVRHFLNNGYPGVKLEKSDGYFRILRKWLYHEGKKRVTRRLLDMLTPKGLAVWWMDDGSLTMIRRNGKVRARVGILSTYISEEENQIIADWLLETYGVPCALQPDKGWWRLRFNTTSLKLWLPVIEPYVIPSLRYKVDMQYGAIAHERRDTH